MTLRSIKRPAGLALTIGLSLSLVGCGGLDGVELNGKVFDWMGVSEAAQAKNKVEPKLAERSSLVVPPNMARLPEPGSGAAPLETATINDPDKRRAMAAAEREKLHREYCSGERNWKERALNPTADTSRSPFGPCNQFIGNALQNKPN
jgi:hypothetical protein